MVRTNRGDSETFVLAAIVVIMSITAIYGPVTIDHRPSLPPPETVTIKVPADQSVVSGSYSGNYTDGYWILMTRDKIGSTWLYKVGPDGKEHGRIRILDAGR